MSDRSFFLIILLGDEKLSKDMFKFVSSGFFVCIELGFRLFDSVLIGIPTWATSSHHNSHGHLSKKRKEKKKQRKKRKEEERRIT